VVIADGHARVRRGARTQVRSWPRVPVPAWAASLRRLVVRCGLAIGRRRSPAAGESHGGR
jgi:hypothetical protein